MGNRQKWYMCREKKEKCCYRLNRLSETIHYWFTNRTIKTIEIIELFYDINENPLL